MKKQRKDEVISTITLKNILWVIGIIWCAILIAAIIIYSTYNPLELIIKIVLIFIAGLASVFLSFLTVAVIARLLKWKI